MAGSKSTQGMSKGVLPHQTNEAVDKKAVNKGIKDFDEDDDD